MQTTALFNISNIFSYLYLRLCTFPGNGAVAGRSCWRAASWQPKSELCFCFRHIVNQNVDTTPIFDYRMPRLGDNGRAEGIARSVLQCRCAHVSSRCMIQERGSPASRCTSTGRVSRIFYLPQPTGYIPLARTRLPSVPATLLQQLRIWGQGLGFWCIYLPTHRFFHYVAS